MQFKARMAQGSTSVERKNVANLASTDKCFLADGRPIFLADGLKELREYFKIPEPKMQRNDPNSDHNILLQIVAMAIDEKRTNDKPSSNIAEKPAATDKPVTTPAGK